MDALLDEDLMFPYCIGVSAGISNSFSYISRQKRRNLVILEQYRNDSRYIGYRNYLRNRSLFGLDFIFGEIPATLMPFDVETFREYSGKLLVGVTNARTGQAEYLNGMDIDDRWTMLRASCAIPLFFPAIDIGGDPYYDGGLCDPIPVRKAISDGNDKHLIILTQPAGYTKSLGRQNVLAGKLLRHKYPLLENILLTRHEKYNETVAFCEQLEREGRAIVLRPDYALDSFEKDAAKLRQTNDHGYQIAMERMPEIRKLFA
jgi:predicted patatin/cPLA2 family phospholipase